MRMASRSRSPRQKADTLSLKKAFEGVMQQMEDPRGGNQ
jgi:hypothetical protein